MKLVPRPRTASPVNRAPCSRSEEHDVVGAVTRRVHGLQGRAGHREPLPVRRTARARKAPGPQRRVRPIGERRGARRVILVVVRHQHVRDLAGGRRDLIVMRRIVGPRIDHDRRALADDPGVRALERVDAWVRREHPGRPQRRYSCSITWRGMVASSSGVGSRLSKHSACTSAAEVHAASSVTVNQVGQYSLCAPSRHSARSRRGVVHHRAADLGAIGGHHDVGHRPAR